MKDQWELYDKEKQYTTTDGQFYTYEEFVNNYPSVQVEAFAVVLYGTAIADVKPLETLKGEYNVYAKDNEEALTEINNLIAAAATESSPLERIASALEYIELYLISKGGNADELR